MSLSKRFRNLAAAFLMALSTVAPMGGALVRSAYAEVGDDAPANSKRLIDNGDGTYTIALSVTGQTSSSSTSNVTKANVILVMDTSSSMNQNAGDVYYPVVGVPGNPANDGNSRPTYYRLGGSRYEQVYYRNGQWRTSNSDRGQVFEGQFYCRSRLWAEKNTLTKTDGIIDELLKQNVSGDAVKSDIIEVAVVGFGMDGEEKQGFTTNATALKNSINGLTTDSGTNWEEALQVAKTMADAKKASQPNEDVYVIFLTDGQPSVTATSSTIASNTTGWNNAWTAASDDARALVTNGYKFYSLFTWGDGNYEHYLTSLVNYAYSGSGNYNSGIGSYGEYYTNADSTDALINALNQIVENITTGVGYTNVELTDGVTEMTTSSIKATTSGAISGLKYYRSGGSYSTTANNGLGDEWADAPAATINEKGEVDWDLGNMTLENGVTYTVAFVVWPSQESLNLIADLNNGKKSYDDLSDDEKAQVAGSNGAYTLKTNTDYPTLTYSTITTTTINGKTETVVSDPTIIDIPNPEPVDLVSEKLDIVKFWEDGLDPSQQEDYCEEDDKNNCSVTLKLMRGDSVYEDNIVVKKNGDTWKAEKQIAIAPGVMVSTTSEGAKLLDISKYKVIDGYVILEEGHKYELQEYDITDHYYLTHYEYHPMLVDGVVKNVIFEYDEDGGIVSIIEMERLSQISATNTLKGGFEVTKTVEGKADVGDQLFTIKTLFDDNAEHTYRIYYGENNPCYNNTTDASCAESANAGYTGRSAKTKVAGTVTLDIYAGDTIRFQDIDTGTKFKVEEVTDGLPLGYSLDEIEYTVKHGDGGYGDYDQDKIDNGWYIVQPNASARATVKNVYDATTLKISKTIDVTHGDRDAAKAKTFNFKVTLKDGDEELAGEYNYTTNKNNSGTIVSGGTITLGDGETATIADLPVGAKYTVEEQEADGFTKTVSADESGTLAKAGAEVAYTNTYDASPVSTQIVALKDFNDWTSDDIFYFTLKENGNTVGTAPVSEETDKKATFDVTYNEPGTYTYTIEESTEGFGDRGITSTPNVLNVTVVVKDDGEGNLYIEGNPEVVSAGTVTNTYKSTGSLTLSASKILTGRDWQEGDSFTFYLYEIVDGEEVKKGEVTATNANAVAFTTINYTTGDSGTRVYVIREATENMPAGVTAETGEVTINVTLTDNHNGSITTNFDNDAHVAQLTNVYKTTPSDPAEAVLKVKKTITDLTNSKKDGNFTFQLQDKDGAKVQEKVVTTENLTGETSFNGISFDEAGTYEYKIVEIAGNTAGFTYDDSVYNVKIVVKDDTTKAKLYVESIEITKDGAAVNEAAFTNIYEADAGDAKVKFDVAKVLNGFQGETPATFTFNMNGNATGSVEITGAGSASFDEISYDKAGEYTYTISEQNDKADGYTYDKSVYTVTVNVVDENGKLVPHTEIKKGEETVNKIEFENNYSASGETTLQITKAFDGDERDWSKESFEFELTGDGIEQAMTATANADGNWVATFDAINYESAGEYKYTITEKESGLKNVEPSAPIEVAVKVVDNGDGTLTATPTYTNNATITNTYTTTGTTAKLHVDKEIDDQSESGVDGTFTFTLSGDSYSDTQNVTTNGGKGGADFKDIEFSKAGTYNFTLKEVKGNEAGYTYDEKEYAVEIVVKDNYEKAQLEVESTKIDGKDTSSITITNVYKATAATYELKVKKTLNGLAEGLEPAVFSFELTGDATGTQTINGSGEASFGEFTYETTGTHNYTIKEVKGSAGGYTYDGAIYTIDVEVVDEGGKLVAKPTIKKDGESATSVEFVNVYKAEGSIDLYVTKDVQGRPWLDSDKFEFTLFDENGEAVGEPVTVDNKNKTAKFTLTYSEKDHNQKYNYTISETGTLPAGMTKPADITATVSVTDNGDGTMKIEATDGGKYAIVNSYKAESVDTTIRVNKKIDDQSNSNNNNHPIGGTFYFMLEGEGYSDYQAVGLRGGVLEGGVDFKAIEFTEAGTYTYTLQEAQGALGNFTYDTNEYTVLVVVEDNYETGKLEVKSVTIAGDETKEWTITNIYKADPVDVQFEVTKVLNGMNEGVEPVEFEFELTGDGIEEAQTVTIKGAGSEKFDPITFEQTGTYKYEIVEIDGGVAGYLYDIAKYIVEVTVTDEGGKLVADVQIKKDGQSASNVTFENNYEATPITDYAIEVNKVLEGRELREGEFSFTLYDEEGNEVMTVLNDADGKVIFDGLSFEKPDTYVFTVKENANENNSDVEFDENEYTITIVVKDNGEGELVIESDDSSDVTFTNIYHEPGRGDTPENPKTEDDIMRNIAMLAISVLGLIGTAVFGKRKLAEDEE